MVSHCDSMDDSCSRPAAAQSCDQCHQGGAESPRKRAFEAPEASCRASTKRRLFDGPMPGEAAQPPQQDAAAGPPAPALAGTQEEGVSVKLAKVVRRVTARQLLQPAPDRVQLDRTFAAFRQEVWACCGRFYGLAGVHDPLQLNFHL